MSTLKDKVSIVTGGTSGIGRTTAIALAKAGSKVVIAGRRQAEGEAVVKEITQTGGEALFVQTDVSDEAQVENLVAKTVEHFGRVDIAFNNAGVEGVMGPTHEQTVANFDHVFDINVKGVFLSMKHQIAQILKQGSGGSIINTASIAGLIALPGMNAYAASKHAVLGLTKAAALEYAPANIRVNAVSPGVIVTDMYDRFTGGDAATQAQFASMHPIGRAGEPREVSDTVIFLAGEGASFITGQSITIDGGFTAQ